MSARKLTRNPRALLTRISLVSVVFLSLLWIAAGPALAAATAGERVTVYYFHRTLRCETCLFIEAVAEGTLRAEFPGQLSDGTLRLRPLDVNLPENSLLVAEFGLRGSDLVVVREHAGGNPAQEGIPDLWGLAEEPERLARVLKDAVVRLLGKKADATSEAGRKVEPQFGQTR